MKINQALIWLKTQLVKFKGFIDAYNFAHEEFILAFYHNDQDAK
jgi:hypothetical protein